MTSSTSAVSLCENVSGDGIFDKLSNVEITKSIWDNTRMLIMPSLARSPSLQRERPPLPIHAICG